MEPESLGTTDLDWALISIYLTRNLSALGEIFFWLDMLRLMLLIYRWKFHNSVMHSMKYFAFWSQIFCSQFHLITWILLRRKSFASLHMWGKRLSHFCFPFLFPIFIYSFYVLSLSIVCPILWYPLVWKVAILSVPNIKYFIFKQYKNFIRSNHGRSETITLLKKMICT